MRTSREVCFTAPTVMLTLLLWVGFSVGRVFAQHESEDVSKMSTRYQKGWEKLREIDGEAGERVIESLKDISPDLGRFIIEYAFGDVYSREGLSVKKKELAVIAAMAAMGTAEPQLKVHIHGALNVGNSRQEVVEAFLHASVYYGFPAALNAINAAKEVFAERDAKNMKDVMAPEAGTDQPTKDRYALGVEYLHKVKDGQEQNLRQAYDEYSPEITRFIVEYAYGDVISRPVLDLQERQLMTVAMLTVMGNASTQLRFHIEGALNVGCTPEEIKEVILLMSVYAGFPAALNGMNVAKDVFQARGVL